jgi:hypothetical protein
MDFLFTSTEVVVGVVLVVSWVIVLRLFKADKPLTAIRFAILPSVMLLWIVLGVLLIAHGVGIV